MEEETAVPAAGWIPADGPDLWGPLGGPGAHRPKAHADVRISNMSLILRHLQMSPALSRTRLARETGLSKATVSTLVAELCATMGLAVALASEEGEGTRVLLAFPHDRRKLDLLS